MKLVRDDFPVNSVSLWVDDFTTPSTDAEFIQDLVKTFLVQTNLSSVTILLPTGYGARFTLDGSGGLVVAAVTDTQYLYGMMRSNIKVDSCTVFESVYYYSFAAFSSAGQMRYIMFTFGEQIIG